MTPLPLGECGALPEPVGGRPALLPPFRRRTPRATQTGISRGNGDVTFPNLYQVVSRSLAVNLSVCMSYGRAQKLIRGL